jgi:DNA mismatch repair endonuclease MutH
MAKRRGWALKPALTRSILSDIVSDLPVESVAAEVAVESFEDVTLARIRPFVARPLRAIIDELGIGSLAGKAKGAVIVRRALGLQERSRVVEFERIGLEVKTVRLSPAGRPYEAMSFPAFRYRELVDEEWPDSDLLGRLNRLLVVPLVGNHRTTTFEDCVLGSPFFWSPTDRELEGIAREWTMFRDEIRAGHALDLTPASRTTYIHVRPKARDGRDTDIAPQLGPVIKKCFWLNKAYVEAIIRSAGDSKGS